MGNTITATSRQVRTVFSIAAKQVGIDAKKVRAWTDIRRDVSMRHCAMAVRTDSAKFAYLVKIVEAMMRTLGYDNKVYTTSVHTQGGYLRCKAMAPKQQ